MNIESAIKYLSVIALLYILARTLAPGFRDFLKEKIFGLKTHSDLDDLDDMIRRKQEIFKTTHGTLSQDQSAKTLQQYKQTSDPELKQTFQIISDLQWGGSETLSTWLEEVNYQKGLDIIPQTAVQLLKQVFHGPSASQFPHPLTPRETKEIFFSLCEISTLLKGRKDETQNWMSSHLITTKHWKRAINFISQQNFKVDGTITKDTLSKGNLLSENELLNISASLTSQKKQVDLSQVCQRIQEVALLFAILDLPASEKKTLSLDEAIEVFEFSELPSEEQLKHRKKMLMKGRHPDKIAHFQLSDELEKITTQRYQMIEIAYNTILKTLKD